MGKHLIVDKDHWKRKNEELAIVPKITKKRGKIKIMMGFIQNKKARKASFAKRMKVFFKKAMELAILCKTEINLRI